MTNPPLEVIASATWADAVAARLADAIASTPALVVCLPTGSTPLPVYDRLPAALDQRDATAAAITVVALDEYLDLPAGHPVRCDAVLRRRLLDRLDPPVAEFVSFDVDGAPPGAACTAIDAAVDACGGIDLVVLGLGRNGHIGMNEPGSTAEAVTRVVELAPSTRRAAIAYGADPPPTHGVTLGMARILAARELWLLATGVDKATILAATATGPITPDVPASLLRDHPGLRIIADADAAG